MTAIRGNVNGIIDLGSASREGRGGTAEDGSYSTLSHKRVHSAMGPLVITDIIVGSVCLTVGLLHLMIFMRRRERRVDLAFSLVAVCAAASAFSEPWVYGASTVEAFARATKMMVTFQGVLWISLIWFIVLYTGTARRWLAFASTAAYLLAVLINLLSPYGVLYADVTALHSVALPWGERITSARGTANPWRVLADVAWVLLRGMSLESCIRLYRRSDRGRAWLLGASLFVFLGLGYGHGTLIDLGIVGPPILINFTFLGLIAVMSVSLTGEVVKASVLSSRITHATRALEDERERMSVILSSLNTGLALINPDMTVSWLNEHARRQLPWDDPEGRKCYSFFDDRTEPCEDCGAIAAFSDGFIHETERFNQKSGRWHWIVSMPVKDPTGKIVNALESVTDITDRKGTEEARDNALKELEALKMRLEEENIYLKQEVREARFSSEIIGRSNALLYVLTRVDEVAPTDATVLIEGETGVGKELIARAIHDAGKRSAQPFIKVNCAALPSSLVESELFGHERGAFTGAERQHKGRFELADGGTLFLDEVSELPPETQAKLLRVLQDGEFERVGGRQTLKTDGRVVAATNHNLKEEVASGRFRPALFYRLHVYPLSVPPLRKRREDIPLLVEYFVPRIASGIGRHIDQIPAALMDRLNAYDWPGNVRELKNVLERAVIVSPGPVLNLPEGFESGLPEEGSPDSVEWHSLEEEERRYILKVLEKTQGRIEGPGGASELLQVKPSTLRYRIQKLGIRRNVGHRTLQ